MLNILLVEDDNELRKLYKTVLIENGYNVFEGKNGEEAFDILDNNIIDLVITDIMMPVMDGHDLLCELRNSSYNMPVLMISASDSLNDKERGFTGGVDDYIVKPVDLKELLWRVKALLRRYLAVSEKTYVVGETKLNLDSLIVSTNGKDIELPQKEFYLLYKLLTSSGKIFTKMQLLNDIWGIESEVDPHTLEVHISRIRSKFKDNNDFEIVTVRGLGYKGVNKSE